MPNRHMIDFYMKSVVLCSMILTSGFANNLLQ